MSSSHDANYTISTILYNLQILPESLLCGIGLMGILLASPSLVILTASAGSTALLTASLGRLTMKMMPDSAVLSSSLDMCTQGHLGRTWERLMGAGSDNPDRLWSPYAPSAYMSVIGFFVGWGFALQQLYQEEIRAGVVRQATLTTTLVISGLILFLAAVFRVMSGCERLWSTLAGLFVGLAVGFMGAIAIGLLSNRSLTNVWGIPLLQDRIAAGAAVYVCPTGPGPV